MLTHYFPATAQNYLISTSDGDTIAACVGNFYDSGSNTANYSDDEKYTATFHAPAGERILFDFTSLNLINAGGDTLRIFDGIDTLSAVIGTYTGEGLSFTVASSDSALTFQFTSDGSLNNAGWEATISCCPSPTSSLITGADTVCAKTLNSKYYINGGVASTYEWFLNGGTIASGTGTDTIYIDWGATAMDTYVKVVEDNGCIKSDTIQLDVRINALPAVSFSGLDSVYQITDSPVTLTGSPTGGIFTGNGITGDQFDPATAGLGTHEIVYTYTDANTCENADTQYVDVRDFDQNVGAIWLTDLNDWCSSDAQHTTTGATADGVASSCNSTGPNNNVWFKFKATTNAVTIALKSGGTYGTIERQQINLWNANGDLVKCSGTGSAWNWQGTITSSIDTLNAGSLYWISIDHFSNNGGQAGSFTLCIADTANFDYKSGAIKLTNLNNWCSTDAEFTSIDATSDESASTCNPTGPNNNVWFKFQATTNAITVDVKTGGTYGTMERQQINIWNANGDLVKCSGTGSAWNWQGTITSGIDTLTLGSWYWISVDHFNNNGGQTGSFTICVDDEPTYDYWSGAEELTDITSWCSSDAVYTTFNATPDEASTSCNTTGPNNNVWFKFQATSTSITIDAKTGGTYGTMERQQINLWNSKKNLIKCATTGSAWDWQGTITLSLDTLTIGNWYWISVDHLSNNGGQKGTFSLCIDNTPTYDYKSGAEELIDLNNWCSSDAAYTTFNATPDENPPSCNGTGPNNNVWFKFRATTNAATVKVKTGGVYGTMERQQITLWNEAGDEVKCASVPTTWNWQGELLLTVDTITQNNWYWISVDHLSNNGGQKGTFTICLDDAPAYDYRSAARYLPFTSNWCSSDAAYSTTNATADEPATTCNPTGPNNNVWFKFQASTNSITVDVKTGGSYGTMERQQVNLWNSNGDLVKCAIPESAWDWQGTITMSIDTLTIDDWYWISVDHLSNNGGEKGTFTFCLDDAPAYDQKAGAIELTDLNSWCSLDAEYSTTNATSDELASSCNATGPNNNVWFYFVATTNSITIDVSSGGSYGTIERQHISLWNTNDDEVKCATPPTTWDWQGTLTLSIDTLTIGNTYWVAVDHLSNNGGQKGSFTICVDDQPNYDYRSGAIELTDINNWCSGDAAYTTTDATPDESASTCNGTGPNNNVWFKFTATTISTTVKVTTGGSYGTMERQQINLWNANGDEVKCTGTGSGWNWQGTIILTTDTLTIGHEYWISVDHFSNNGGQKGSFTLCVDDGPAYDYKTGAEELTDLDNWCSSNAVYSTKNASPDEIAATCNATGPNNNVWFKFQALTDTVTIDVSTGGAFGDMERQHVALWNTAGNEIHCVGPGAAWNWQGTITLQIDTLTVGNWYRISVDHLSNSGGQKGTFTLCINNTNETYYSRADGDWTTNATWSKVSHVGVAATSYPIGGDIVYIQGHAIQITSNEACASLRITTDDANTSLTIVNDTLNINGKLYFDNNGADYNGSIILQDTSNLDINNDFLITRSGGANEFKIELTNHSNLVVRNDMIWTNSGGTVNNSVLNIQNQAELNVNNDFTLNYSGGTKILATMNDTAKINISRDISLTSTAANTIEFVFNDTSSLSISRNILRGTPQYGILDFNNNSTIEFNSTDYLQIIPEISGAGGDYISYQNVIIDNSRITTPQITLEGPVTINGILNLKDGIVSTTSTNLLTLANTATINGGSVNSFIDGPIQKTGNTSFEFPVGDQGTYYNPLTISAPSVVTDAFTAEYSYENSDPTYDHDLKDDSLYHISETEYWTLNRTAGTSTINVTLNWNNNSECVYDIDTIDVAAWNGSQWVNYGNNITTGTIAAGTITPDSSITLANNILTFGNNLPRVNITDLDAEYCESDAAEIITGHPTNANGLFTGDGIIDHGNGTATFDPSVSGDGTFQITYTYTEPSGCTNEITNDVVVHNPPASTVTGSDTICEGSTTDISIYFSGTAPWTCTYTNLIDTTTIITGDNPYVFTVADTGIYHVITLYDANTCNGTEFGDTATIGWRQTSKPVITPAGPIIECEGTPVILTSTAGNDYFWSTGEHTQSINATTTDDYTVQIIDSYNCVSPVSDPVSVTINPAPTTGPQYHISNDWAN